MSAVEKDARAHSDANGASTAWEKAARDLGRATRESLRRERHTAEEPFIALTAHLIVWAAAIGGPDHGILLRSDHQNSPPWVEPDRARGEAA